MLPRALGLRSSFARHLLAGRLVDYRGATTAAGAPRRSRHDQTSTQPRTPPNRSTPTSSRSDRASRRPPRCSRRASTAPRWRPCAGSSGCPRVIQNSFPCARSASRSTTCTGRSTTASTRPPPTDSMAADDGAGLRIRSAARAVVIDDRHRILLVRWDFPERPALGLPQMSVWGTPGGGIEPGEEIEPALRRELAEELGLDDPRDRTRDLAPSSRHPLPRRAVGRTARSLLSDRDASVRTGATPHVGAAARRAPHAHPVVDAGGARRFRADLDRAVRAPPLAGARRRAARPWRSSDPDSTPASEPAALAARQVQCG